MEEEDHEHSDQRKEGSCLLLGTRCVFGERDTGRQEHEHVGENDHGAAGSSGSLKRQTIQNDIQPWLHDQQTEHRRGENVHQHPYIVIQEFLISVLILVPRAKFSADINRASAHHHEILTESVEPGLSLAPMRKWAECVV